jgi:hypothetical protein
MPQFRLTQKFAVDCKIAPLSLPLTTNSVFDDWVIDVIRIARKKVAMATHVTSALTFLIPYARAGKATSVPSQIEKCLIGWLTAHQLAHYTKELVLLFQGPPYFCKTKNRQILGYMNDFKGHIAAKTYDSSFESIHWDEINHYLHHILISRKGRGYDRPEDIFLNLLMNLS